MLWPHDSETQGNTLPKPWPLYTIGLIGLFVFLYALSLFGHQSEKAIQSAKEKVICAYLKRDYTKIPASTLRLLPKELKRHHKRTSAIMLRYDRDPSSAKAEGLRLLQDSDQDTPISNQGDGKSCLQQAIAKGKFVQYPKQRIFVALAQITSHERHKQQQEIERLAQAFQQTRQSHVLYGWGLIGSERRWFTFLTSLLIVPSWFVLFWQLPLLWLVGTMLERRWRSPLWLAIFGISALFGNILLILMVGKSTQPMVGSGAGIAALVGMWTASVTTKDITYAYWKPKSTTAGKITFQGWFVTVAWLLLAGLSTLIFHPHPLIFLLVALLCLGMGAGALLALETFDLVIPHKLEDTKKVAPLLKGQSFLQKTITATRTATRKATSPRPATPSAAANQQVNQARLKQLTQHVNDALAAGNKEGAVNMYRDAIKEEKGALWVLEGLLVTCEKAAIVAKPDEYVRAIRAAAAIKQQEKTRTFLSLLTRHRKTGAVTLSSRDQLGLATDLKRAGLFQEALIELEDLLQNNDENAFYIKSTLLKVECIQQLGRPPQEAMALLNQLEPLLESFPEFRTVIEQEHKRAQKRLGVAPELPQPSSGQAGQRGFGNNKNELFASASESGFDDDEFGGLAEDDDDAPLATFGAFSARGTANTGKGRGPLPASISTAPDEQRDVEVDVSLLEEIEMFEALRAPSNEREPAADSWSELPSLLLHQDSQAPDDDIPSMFEEKKDDHLQRLGDSGLSPQQRLAEEVTAAFDVSGLQENLGGDWGGDWDDGESAPAPTPQPTFTPPAAPPTPSRQAPEEPLGAGLVPMNRPVPSIPPAQETAGNYQASLPPLLSLTQPAQMPASLNETRVGPVQIADGAALLPFAEEESLGGNYQPTLPPVSPSPPKGAGLLDLTEEIDEPSK